MKIPDGLEVIESNVNYILVEKGKRKVLATAQKTENGKEADVDYLINRYLKTLKKD